ncbi:hypothetical protein [Barnesiella intestinihominis]|uniref:hypothetical protein n=1 Tax=Barnesiella intestinihominis TaxID=487174 RepID=UPI002FDA99D8
MERKVGEIFEYNGEWYQCMHVPQKHSCKLCDLRGLCCDNNGVKIVTCAWRHRKDNTSVIFKKLEKVGEPTMLDGKLVQKILKTDRYSCNGCCFESPECDKPDNDLCCEYEIYVEIKQNKEDMEEEKLNLKKFDLEAAKAGKPVCTRDGRKARIICFDRNWEYPIVALIECENGEEMISACDKDGKARIYETQGTDLMMLPQKKEGWVRIYKSASNVYYLSSNIYKTEEEAKHSSDCCYVGASKISWEE